ncbi:MAG: NYN domain-containing protein [Planctomycetes bacterium]|nr:NYN domain-containing protein [Planctomycetota bacterium]
MNSAVFVDFENLHRALEAPADPAGPRPKEIAIDIVEGLLRRLREEDGDTLVMGRSYAAFDTFPGNEVAHELALLGVDPQYVLVGPTGRNSGDVQLTLDVARVLFRRPDIGRIVILTGDRDFLPLAREVLEVGRELLMCAIAQLTSGDLRQRIGDARFVDALGLVRRAAVGVPPIDGGELPGGVAAPTPFTTDGDGLADLREGSAAVVVGHIPVTWETSKSAEKREELLLQCLELIMRARMRHGSDEVWLSPFLKGPMSQHFAHIVHPERRALVNELRNRGAIRVEERENLRAEHPYSVIVIEDEHPMAKQVWARLRSVHASS